MVQGYCVKCRKKVEMVDPKEKTNQRNVLMLQSLCSTCGCKVNTFVKRERPAVS